MKTSEKYKVGDTVKVTHPGYPTTGMTGKVIEVEDRINGGITIRFDSPDNNGRYIDKGYLFENEIRKVKEVKV